MREQRPEKRENVATRKRGNGKTWRCQNVRFPRFVVYFASDDRQLYELLVWKHTVRSHSKYSLSLAGINTHFTPPALNLS